MAIMPIGPGVPLPVTKAQMESGTILCVRSRLLIEPEIIDVKRRYMSSRTVIGLTLFSSPWNFLILAMSVIRATLKLGGSIEYLMIVLNMVPMTSKPSMGSREYHSRETPDGPPDESLLDL